MFNADAKIINRMAPMLQRVMIVDPQAASARLIGELMRDIASSQIWVAETTQGARSWKVLPANAVKYVRRIEELIGAPVALLSTSPEREDTILMRDPFHG